MKKKYLIFFPLVFLVIVSSFSLIDLIKIKGKLSFLLKTKFYSNCDIKKISFVPYGSTVIAGHIYKNNNPNNEFINDNLINFLSLNINKINKIIFSGDIFETPSKKKWEDLYNLFGLGKNILIAPGNHDIGFNDDKLFDLFRNSKLFYKEFPYKISASEFSIIIEDSISNEWILNNKTIKLINGNHNKNPIILVRHNIPISNLLFLANSKYAMSDKVPNFKKLDKLINKNITIISGDGGNNKNSPRFFCTKRNKITYIVNGLGGFKQDSIILLYDRKLFKYEL